MPIKLPRIQFGLPGGLDLALTGLLIACVAGLLAILSTVEGERPAGRQVYGGADLDPAGEQLLIASFNIRRAKGTDGRTDLARIGDMLRLCDVVWLSELSYLDAQGPALARQLGMTFIPAPTETVNGRPSFGNGLLTRVAARDVRVEPLPKSGGRGERNLLIATLPLAAGGHLTIIGTHVAFPKDAPEQLDLVLEAFETADPPVLLMGDLNATADQPRLAETLARDDVKVATLDGDNRIDWLLLRGNVDITDGGVVETVASDHPAIWTRLKLSRPD